MKEDPPKRPHTCLYNVLVWGTTVGVAIAGTLVGDGTILWPILAVVAVPTIFSVFCLLCPKAAVRWRLLIDLGAWDEESYEQKLSLKAHQIASAKGIGWQIAGLAAIIGLSLHYELRLFECLVLIAVTPPLLFVIPLA